MIQSLQVLRFFAAALVLLAHLEERLQGFADRSGAAVHLLGISGELGVRVFFLISGFLMLRIGEPSFGQPGAGRAFFWDRLTRILPLYWLMTGLQMAFLLWAAGRGDARAAANSEWVALLASLLFVPYENGTGAMRPVLEQGWTLNYEMFFYLLFALCLGLRRARGLPLIFGLLAACVLLGPWVPPGWVALQAFTDPLLIAFALGMGLALARQALERAQGPGLSLPRVPGLLPLLLGLLVLAHGLMGASPLGRMVPTVFALVAVALCVLTRDIAADTAPRRWLVRQGAASYSLYLSHGFCLLVVGMLWRKLFGGQYLLAYGLTAVALSLGVAVLSWRWWELPMTRLLRHGSWAGSRVQPRAA